MSASSARAVALKVIRRVTEQGGYSNLVLPAELGRSGLSARDRALATELAYGTLRRIIPLDRALADHAGRPMGEVTRGALAALRLGAFQLLETRIPAHAAVSETVGLVSARERGFVNAVLRSLAKAPVAPVAPVGPFAPVTLPDGEGDEDVAVRTGLAAWAVRELRRLLGDEAEAAAAALARPGPLSLRANTCRVSVRELEGALGGAGHSPVRGALWPETLLLAGPRSAAPTRLPGFRRGWFAVQDQASAFVSGALAVRPGDRVLDACAGPGGKSGHIGCLAAPGGRVIAADVAPKRAALAAAAASRLGVRVLALAQDARRPALSGPFDRVLVDAPCSGIGSARRRPELLWRASPEDLSGLARLQVAIAVASAGLLRPGGRLVYSVCTFPRAETDAACDAIVRKCPDLEPQPIAGPDGDAARVRLWPHRHGTDAMFVAAFRRRGDRRR